MLSDEERKALYMISLRRKGIPPNGGFIADNEEITIILNLIEKQSKEIEELKKERLTLFDTTVKNSIKINDKKWEDKIKAKIEEIKEERRHYLEINDEYNAQICDCIIEEYKSLLEKE